MVSTRCVVLVLLASAILADVNSDLWESYADQIRNSVGFSDTMKNNPDYTLSITAKSTMLLLGNDDPCIHNQAVTSIADSMAAGGPIYVPGTGGFYSAYKLFLNSIKPKTTNNPSLIPQLAKDKQNYLKLADTYTKMQMDVFQGYKDYKSQFADIPGGKPLDLISWRVKYYPKYAVIENSVSALKTKIDTAEAQLWGPAFTTIQDAKKKLAMAESLETQTAYNMPVCPTKATKALQDYEDPSNWAGSGDAPPSDSSSTDTTGASAVENYAPQYSIQGAQKFLEEMRNAALSGDAQELRIQVTKTKRTFSASDFGWWASATVSYTPFLSVTASTSTNIKKRAGTSDFDSIDIAFAGHRTLTIDPPPWYDNALVVTFWDSLYPDMEGKLFGPDGQFNVIPKQVVLGYNPSFRIQMSRESWSTYSKDVTTRVTTRFGIGPFSVSASAGTHSHEESSNYDYQEGVLEIKVRSDSLFLLAVVGQKVVSSGKKFLALLGQDEAHLNMVEEQIYGNRVNWQQKSADIGGSVESGYSGGTGADENADGLVYDLTDVNVKSGEVQFAFTKNGFNIDQTDDAVYSAAMQVNSKGHQPRISQ